MPVVRDIEAEADRMSESDETASSSSLSDSELDDRAANSDGGWGSPILPAQSYSCTANGTTNHTELAVVTDDSESMQLFAVSWRSRMTPTEVNLFGSDINPTTAIS